MSTRLIHSTATYSTAPAIVPEEKGVVTNPTYSTAAVIGSGPYGGVLKPMGSAVNGVEEPPRDSLVERVLDVLGRIEAPASNIELRHAKGVGAYVLITFSCSARKAMEYWLRIIEIGGLSLPVFVKWEGETDAAPEELGSYIGRILAKMGLFLETEEPVDAVKAVREEWGG